VDASGIHGGGRGHQGEVAVSQRDAFLNALEENEDDVSMRLVYSDWLDEQGEHEEADRQRKWPAAKAWLVRFCRDYNPTNAEETGEWVISYNELIDLGRQAIKDADHEGMGFSCGNNMDMCDALRAQRVEFWQHWSIVTGIPVPLDAAENSGFSCAC
jgi:uncharacterized protein (TIGR02996 family)